MERKAEKREELRLGVVIVSRIGFKHDPSLTIQDH